MSRFSMMFVQLSLQTYSIAAYFVIRPARNSHRLDSYQEGLNSIVIL